MESLHSREKYPAFVGQSRRVKSVVRHEAMGIFLTEDVGAELAIGTAARLAAVTAVKKDGWPQDKGRKIASTKHVLRSDFELDVDSID